VVKLFGVIIIGNIVPRRYLIGEILLTSNTKRKTDSLNGCSCGRGFKSRKELGEHLIWWYLNEN